MKNYYSIIRLSNTETDFIIDAQTVETRCTEWKDFLKYAKAQYTVLSTQKRRHYIIVA